MCVCACVCVCVCIVGSFSIFCYLNSVAFENGNCGI